MTNQVKVGIFSIATIIIFVLGFYFLKGTNIFQRSDVYYAVYDRVDGLYKSNVVDISGLQVGRVGDLQRNPVTGKIVVRLDLDKGVQLPKSDSTVAIIISTDFLGGRQVRLFLGNSNEFYKAGDTINTSVKKDLSEQLTPIATNIANMVPSLDTAVGGVKMLFDSRQEKSIYTTLAKLNNALDGINGILAQNQKNLQTTFKNLESISSNIEKNNAAITKIINNAANLTDSLQQANIKQTVQNLNTTVDQLKGMLNDINKGKGTLGKVVKDDALYNKVDSAVTNLNVLLKDVKARPYRYIKINVFGAKKAEERRAAQDNETGK